MKILIYSPPFSGHLNVLTTMMKMHQSHEYKLVITGWNNVSITELNGAIHLGKSQLQETDPALWTFARVAELLDDSLAIAREYQPNLIIYDYFSLEGYFTGKILGIPAWCSISGMMGPNVNTEYLERKLREKVNRDALAQLREKYGIDVEGVLSAVEMISDGLHLPADVNLVWSYQQLTPAHFMEGRKKSLYYFLGNYNRKIDQHKDIIYFSLGTVVMDNLWNKQEETRTALQEFVAGVALGLSNENVVFVTQGKKVLESYPEHWRIETSVDQVQMLSMSKVFITHGGNNSFHEAVLQQVPMVVIPFFGDQIMVGQRVEELGVGINLDIDSSIDTKKSKHFLTKELGMRAAQAVREILDDPVYQSKLENLELSRSGLVEVIGKHFQKKEEIIK